MRVFAAVGILVARSSRGGSGDGRGTAHDAEVIAVRVRRVSVNSARVAKGVNRRVRAKAAGGAVHAARGVGAHLRLPLAERVHARVVGAAGSG